MPLRAVLCWAQTAEGYRAMLSEEWLPRVGAAICAAHYLEHQLRWAGQGATSTRSTLLLAHPACSAAAEALPAAWQLRCCVPCPVLATTLLGNFFSFLKGLVPGPCLSLPRLPAGSPRACCC